MLFTEFQEKCLVLLLVFGLLWYSNEINGNAVLIKLQPLLYLWGIAATCDINNNQFLQTPQTKECLRIRDE